jgi:hypothetical protein
VASPPPATATRIENTDLSITYTAGTDISLPAAWFHGSTSRDWSGGTASFDRSGGARATLAFTGTSVTWIGFRAWWAGIARVSVDGGAPVEVDLYVGAGLDPGAPKCPDPRPAGCVDEQTNAPVFMASGLGSGPHTLTVEVTGRRNPNAPADCAPTLCNAVVVDAFDVAPASPPAVAGTRFEETAASMSAGWTSEAAGTARAWSGGAAAVSSTAGARATFTFTGTEVDWVGLRGPQNGIARIFLDGALHAEVDTYSPTEIQSVVFTALDLVDASHTLAIEVTGLKASAATDARIVVDAIDVRTRFEDSSPSVVYTACPTCAPSTGWTLWHTDKAWSGTSPLKKSGTASLSSTAGARAEFTFTGTSVTWIGFRGPGAGMADVSLDGASLGRVDLYAATEQLRAPVFTAANLVDGTHKLRIDVTGLQNPAATGAVVVVDAFDTTPSSPAPPVTRFQDAAATYVPSGNWAVWGVLSFWSGGTVTTSTTVGSQATLTFTGKAIRWIGYRRPEFGVARVSVDGVVLGQVDTSTPSFQEEFQAGVFSVTGLAAGSHTLTIEVIGRNGEPAGATVGRVIIDAFEVYDR